MQRYLPTPKGHAGWYAEFRLDTTWRFGKTLETSMHELMRYTDG